MKSPLTKTAATLVTLTAALCGTLTAQNNHRMIDPLANLPKKQKNLLVDQAKKLSKASLPAVSKATKSTVAISHQGSRIAFGIALTKEGKILTKWSEISRVHKRLTITTHSGKHHPAKVLGVYPEHDLAVLKINANLQPIDLTTAAPVEQGSFLVLARHDGGVEGRGVVSVKTRSLKLSDRGFLGVMLDFSAASKQGVPLREVVKQSAAERAGLQGGDIITTIEGTPIQGAMEMRSTLQKLRPGDKIKVGYRRGKEEHTTTVSLGTRPKTSAPAMQGRRKAAMERMGAIPSRVRDNFPSVIQSDMAVEKEDAGAPVTDLDGNVVGIVIARASRIKTYIIPASTLLEITASDPKNIASLPPSPLDKNGKIARNTTRPSRAIPQNEDLPEDIEKVRRLLGEVERSGNDNEENLRKIREALRLLQGDDR